MSVQRRILIALLLLLLACAGLGARAAAAPDPLTVILVPDLPASLAPGATIARTAQALQDWANADLAPAWGLPPVRVVALPRGAHPPPARGHQWLLHLRASTDVYGALGYHTISRHGIPWGEVGVGDAQDQDGTWTICASHELAELLIDPYANRIAFREAHHTLTGWMVEVADPVADQRYGFGDRGHLYQIADFTYPSEFTPGAGYPYDKLHLLHAPFSTTPRGYLAQFRVRQTPVLL